MTMVSSKPINIVLDVTPTKTTAVARFRVQPEGFIDPIQGELELPPETLANARASGPPASEDWYRHLESAAYRELAHIALESRLANIEGLLQDLLPSEPEDAKRYLDGLRQSAELEGGLAEAFRLIHLKLFEP